MKTNSAQPKVVAKAGSVSLRGARAAARAAKSGHRPHLVNDDAIEVSSLWERYLGHFGGVQNDLISNAKANPARKTGRKHVKRAAKKTGVKKKTAKKR